MNTEQEYKSNLDKFIEYMKTEDGKMVYQAALAEVHNLLAAGFRTFGVNAIIEKIRWDKAIELGPKGKFKINNNIAPYLARALLVYNQEIPETFFKLKKIKGVA